MIVALSRNRYLDVPTGTLILVDRERGVVEYSFSARLAGRDATVAIEGLDELLRRQDADTATLRFGLAKSDCGPSPVTGQPVATEPRVAITVDDVGYEPDPRD